MTAPAGNGVQLARLELLYEAPGLSSFELPAELLDAFGGTIGFPTPRLYARLAAGLDGTAIPGPADGSVRFRTGLLRACAEAVLFSPAALNGPAGEPWSAAAAYPAAAPFYARLRRLRGQPPRPAAAVWAADGRIDLQRLPEGALVLTSAQGAARLGGRGPGHVTLVEAGAGSIDPLAALAALRARGHELVLCDGGPGLVATLAEAGLLDELFVTHAPSLASAAPGGEVAPPERVAPLREPEIEARLLSLRRAGSHLFARYELSSRRPQPRA